MSLHKATEFIKKFGIGVGIGLGVILVVTIFIRIGIFVVSIIVPPKITPPNQALGPIPAIEFPKSKIENSFTYSLNTVSGTLPSDFPDRLIVYPLAEPEPNFLNLDKAKEKAKALDFIDQQGKATPEVDLGDGNYEWTDAKELVRKLKIDTVSFNFSLTSNYLAQLTVLGAQNLPDEATAIEVVSEFLKSMELLYEDIDFKKIESPSKESSYDIYPKVFTIRNGVLVPTTSLSTAKVVRVDLHQKDIEYDLDTGRKNAPKIKMTLPIRYPNPPFSTMSFWVASGETNPEVFAANFIHYEILTKSEPLATYPLKNPEVAFEELKNSKAYVASYSGLEQQIQINKVYLAYYLGEHKQSHLIPIYVFEGQDGFLAYVSAIRNE
ncbi:MAG TPA: hypothetical protein VM077_02275 [Candidatus Limnocylindrales bacterium]|nr:hypothetical protein [Candidatus Limnocylindrales bacterium]